MELEIKESMAKETTTVIKKILPYLVRLGYSVQNDLFFEEAVKKGSKIVGFTDIEVYWEGADSYINIICLITS